MVTEQHQDEHQWLARHYEKAQKYLFDELDLLSRKLNYFLIATAFLVAAYVASVTSANEIQKLSHAIASLACFISIAFFIVNYINARIVNIRSNYFRKIPKNVKSNWSPFQMHKHLVDNLHGNSKPKEWLKVKELSRYLWATAIRPFSRTEEDMAAHTWVIPLILFIFWLVVWGVVSSWFAPLIFLGAVLLLMVIRLYWVPYIESGIQKIQKQIAEVFRKGVRHLPALGIDHIFRSH
ncbi:hypothetical protein ACFLX5_04045 [Chloroflexota bacterium]